MHVLPPALHPPSRTLHSATLQVRCMAAVLIMVGRGDEEPSIVQRLLDIQATPQARWELALVNLRCSSVLMGCAG